MGYHEDGAFRFAGRVGTGFTEATLAQLTARLEPLRRATSPFTSGPKPPRGAEFVEPCLVAEVEFVEWTSEGVMRAPAFKGFRDDKSPREVAREDGDPPADEPGGADPAAPEALFDEVERLPEGALAVLTDGRRLKLSNWDKVLFPQTGFTKGDLIAFYARLAPTLVPHLRDRPLTLKRYPSGVDEAYFYEKQSPSHRPEWVQTEQIGDVNYTLAQDRATLVWLGNLADVELHTSLALASAPQRPTMLVFDLDPGPPAGIIECCEVALVLRGLFEQLGLQSVVKTSGSKGMQVYVPLNTATDYGATKTFARRVAELLEQRMPELVVSRMTKKLRPGKVLVDWSQNDAHKTTVSVYSVRARERPTVSAPVTWEEVARCRELQDGDLLTFDTEQVLERTEEQGDLFAPLLSLTQKLPAVG
jgi:bifunctional non-homologous end joining protein LigD